MVFKQPYLASWKKPLAIFIAYLPIALGVVGCDECKPVDLQRAPGTTYNPKGNRTIRPLAVISGTAQYREAMRTIIEESSGPHNWPWRPTVKTQYIPYTEWWWPVIWAKFRIQDAISPPNLDAIYPDPVPDHYIAIASMLSNIESTDLDPLDPPLKYKKVFLSVPDAPPLIYEVVNRFELPCSLAGLEMLGGNLASLHALQYDGVDNWWGPGTEPPAHVDFYYPRTMLTISFNAASLGCRDPVKALQSPRHGADYIQNIEGFWDEVQELLASTIGDAPVDHVLLIGSHAREVGLVQALVRVIKQSENIYPALLGRYRGTASAEDKRDALFASANQATLSVKRGMKSGYVFCIVPDYCPVGEGGHEEFEGLDWYVILGVPKEPIQ